MNVCVCVLALSVHCFWILLCAIFCTKTKNGYLIKGLFSCASATLNIIVALFFCSWFSFESITRTLIITFFLFAYLFRISVSWITFSLFRLLCHFIFVSKISFATADHLLYFNVHRVLDCRIYLVRRIAAKWRDGKLS